MASRKIYDSEHHAQFLTCTCYHRRRMLDCEQMRDELTEFLIKKLRDYEGICSGYVIMPDHFHTIVWFEESDALSRFMKSLKQTSSMKLKRMLRAVAPRYANKIPMTDPFWTPKYYPFNLYASRKAEEKLDYMHNNPVAAGLVKRVIDWRWSSARHFLLNEPSPVPLNWIF